MKFKEPALLIIGLLIILLLIVFTQGVIPPTGFVLSEELTSQRNSQYVTVEGATQRVICMVPTCYWDVYVNENTNQMKVCDCADQCEMESLNIIDSHGVVVKNPFLIYNETLTSLLIHPEVGTWYVYSYSLDSYTCFNVYVKDPGEKYCTLVNQGAYLNGNFVFCGGEL